MKFYPPTNKITKEDLTSGKVFVWADVKCEDCNHEMPLAMAGSIDNGKCVRCGGKTS